MSIICLHFFGSIIFAYTNVVISVDIFFMCSIVVLCLVPLSFIAHFSSFCNIFCISTILVCFQLLLEVALEEFFISCGMCENTILGRD